MAFPNTVFPGVYTRLVDTSFSIAASGASTAFIALMSPKGKDNQLLSMGSVDELLSTLGSIDSSLYGQGMLVLSNWFIAASSAYVIRVLPDSTNLPSQTSVYEGNYGTYSLGKIKMKEAAYANLAIAVNSLGKLELTQVGPTYYGDLKAVNATTPPTETPSVGDKYAISYEANTATGDWLGKEGKLATCNQATPTVVWQYEDISSIGYATVDGVEMAVGVNIVNTNEKVTEWRTISSYEEEDVTVVNDILSAVPETPVAGDIYLIGSPAPVSGVWATRNGQVAEYDGEAWKFTTPDTVLIGKEFASIANLEASAETVGKKYFVATNATGALADHQGAFAVGTSTTSNETTTYSWNYILPSIASDGSQVTEIIISNSSDSTLLKYAKYVVTEKKIIWTTDMDATFPAYIRRTNEIDSILSTSRPDLADSDNSTELLYVFYAAGRGTYYNNIMISMSLSSKSQHEDVDYDRTLILDIYDTNSGSKLLLESYEVSLNPEATDPVNDTSLYICNVLSTYSSILCCKAVDKAYLTKTNAYMVNANTEIDALFTNYETSHVVGTTVYSPALSFGTNGNLYKDNGSLNWTVAKNLLTKAYTGVIQNPDAADAENPYLTDVLDTEMVLIDLVLDAGYPKEVKTSIIDLITARSNDCIGLVDMLDNASVEAAYKARTQEGGVGKQFNTPYIAIYEPYTEIYDKYSGNDLWVTPIYHIARAYAVTDRDYGRQYAPAGINRGMCYGINKMRYNLYRESSYKDKFVSYCINPIIANRNGYVIYGQSTSYLKASKFQDVNIIRPVIEIERDLRLELQNMLFDFNDEDTYSTIDAAVRAYLGNKMADNVIEGYDVKVYASDYDVTQHKVRVDITLQPKYVIYQILVTISV